MRLTLLFYFDGFIPVHCRLYFLRAWVSEMNYYWAWLVYTTSRHHEAFLSLFDLISHLFPRMTDPFFKGLTQDHIFLTAEVEKVTNTVNLYLCCNPLRLLTPGPEVWLGSSRLSWGLCNNYQEGEPEKWAWHRVIPRCANKTRLALAPSCSRKIYDQSPLPPWHAFPWIHSFGPVTFFNSCARLENYLYTKFGKADHFRTVRLRIVFWIVLSLLHHHLRFLVAGVMTSTNVTQNVSYYCTLFLYWLVNGAASGTVLTD